MSYCFTFVYIRRTLPLFSLEQCSGDLILLCLLRNGKKKKSESGLGLYYLIDIVNIKILSLIFFSKTT